ncbi:MAG: SPOR domain-containing protein [Legionellales bacterium]|nr:SPOR domain-containing protein [Legionellales bacterium]
MAKDFAVQNYKKNKSTSMTSLIIGIITVVFVLLFYLFVVKHKHKASYNSKEDRITKIIEKEVEQPRFKFYTMLSGNNNSNTVDQEGIEYGNFVLSIAEFNFKAEAVKLQRRLESKNYLTNIKKIMRNGKTYYSVEMGKYSNNIEAKQAKLDLEKIRYKSSIRKVD